MENINAVRTKESKTMSKTTRREIRTYVEKTYGTSDCIIGRDGNIKGRNGILIGTVEQVLRDMAPMPSYC